jgi:hypothetical protein
MNLLITNAAIRVGRASLTSIPRALKNPRPDLFPVFRVSGSLFFSYRHQSPNNNSSANSILQNKHP